MAEALLFGLATSVVASIASETGKPAGSYASQNIQLLCCAKNELQSLEGTAEAIQAVLLDAEEKQQHSKEVKLWLQRLKDMLYEIDDLLDEVATKDRRQKVIFGKKMSKAVRVFFFKLNKLAYRVKVGYEIQEVRKRLDGFKKDSELLNLDPRKREETTGIWTRKKTETIAPDKNIIGREEDKKHIKRLLFAPSSSSQSVSYIAIVGKGGLGKTALARLVYNDGEVEQRFELKMWVCVSDVFDVNSIIKEILKSVKDNCQKCDDEMKKILQDLENKPMEQLCRHLRDFLSNNKYLLVLDDLWSDNRLEWTNLGEWLEHGSPGSKILLTTHSSAVAQATPVASIPHILSGLSKGKSWDLFRKMAFGDELESIDPPDLENIARGIVKKCAGVPLAIRHVGSLLRGREKDVWLRYKEHELPEIPEIDKDDKGILQVLRFSYDHLPSSLKHCFAYCSLCPKDYVYDKEEMIHQWIAQGFVELGDRDDKLEVANNCFSELVSRSFLDVEKTKINGEVVYFKMHDLMHDLAQIVAGGECKIIKFDRGYDERRIRHASFISKVSSEKEMKSLLKNSKLRTFLYLKGESSVLNSDEVFSRCRRCRVLGLDDIEIPLPPSSFGKLKHLRFLNISRIHSIQSLPDSISDLVNLQFLKITECKELQTISGDWRKLDNLTFISIENCPSLRHLPPLSEIPSLRSLILRFLTCSLNSIQQTSEVEQYDTTSPFFPSLERLALSYCGVKEWWEKQVMRASENHRSGNSQLSFPNLRSLDIYGCGDLNMVPSFPRVEYMGIDSMEYLKQQLMAYPNCPSESTAESTPVSFSQLKRLLLYTTGYRGDMETSLVGTLLRSASNLKSMFLAWCDLRALSCAMRYLSSLEELDFFNCYGLEFTCQEGYNIPWQLFAKLRVLRFSFIDGLVTLPEEIQHVTTLQLLEIDFCEDLESLPEWIGNFSLLKKIVLSRCRRLKCLAFNMRNLRSLEELKIRGCAALKESCLPMTISTIQSSFGRINNYIEYSRYKL